MSAAAVLSPDSALQQYSLRSRPIPRVAGISREDFEREYMENGGSPVIVTDAAERWPAMQKWDFRWLSETCGDMPVLVKDDLFNPTCSRVIRLRRFLIYCQYPWTSPLNNEPTDHPFYVSFKPFVQHPELMQDFAQPYFFDNVYDSLPEELRPWYWKVFGYLFVGPKGTVTPLHVDLFATHAWLTQIVGRKHMILFSPREDAKIYGGKVDPLQPDLEKYPLLAEATAHEAVLAPGETILFPAGWYHYVRSLDASISLSFNGVNRTNYLQHILSIATELPRWARLVTQPEFRDPIGLPWNPETLAQAVMPAGPRIAGSTLAE